MKIVGNISMTIYMFKIFFKKNILFYLLGTVRKLILVIYLVYMSDSKF